MKKTELLAPAGSLEKLKIAIKYGADAVFIGGKYFSLRARSSNFEIVDILAATSYAHKYGKKVYVTLNILPHNDDLVGLEKYLAELSKANVDAVIVASITIAKKAIEAGLETHLSTQCSVTNSKSIEFYQSLGIQRVVLARELNLEEIALVNKNSQIEVEVFIHGGMCVSYSGRCTLSNYMTDRDANRGGCAHSCRWNYQFKENSTDQQSEYFAMSSKDLNGVVAVTKLLDIGVDSLKIEGRMKSVHYIATVVGNYRKLIDEYYEKGTVNLEYYQKEILKAENRLTSTGFLLGDVTDEQHLYNMRSEKPTQNFIAHIKDYLGGYAIVEERNKFSIGDTAEVYGPNIHKTFIIEEILNEKGQSIEVARHPKEILKVKIPFAVQKDDLIRKVIYK